MKRICIISSNFPSKKRVGGFASMTTQLGLALKNNYDVIIAVPKKTIGKNSLSYKGIQVRGLTYREMIQPSTYRKLDADIYHSQNPTLMSLFASLYDHDAKHIVTCRDPRNLKDWIIEFKHATPLRRLKTPLSCIFEEGFLVKWAIRRADIVGVPAYFLKKKIKKMYGLKKDPLLIPNIEDIPKVIPRKSERPMVCFVGRLDRRKKPERVLQLAQKFLQVEFHIIGRAEEDGRQKWLESKARKLPNVIMHGLLNKFNSQKLYELYNKSWILINTSAREGLPLTFIEAAGRGCAILSNLNPDNFSSKFGYWAKKDDFENGLQSLLRNKLWKQKGKKAHAYVHALYSRKEAVRKHIALYESLFN